MERNHLLNWALSCISDILIKINESKGFNWELFYRRETDESIKSMTGWEYIYIRHLITGDLLYAVNVTGDSVLTALSEFMDLLSRKF